MNNPRCKKVVNGINYEQGIFNYLSQTTHSNIYTSKVIDIKSSNIYQGQYEYLFDHSKDTYLRVCKTNDDFKTQKINLEKYYLSVPSSKTGAANGRLKTWKVEGSNDNQKWDEIDSKENDSSFNGYGKSNYFTCKSNNNNYYQFIRIKCFADHYDTTYFLLSEIELYGSIMK